MAEDYIAQLDKAALFPHHIVTRVDPLRGFYAAEDYHQDYLVNHPDQPYIAFNDLPKVENFRRLLPALYSPKAVTVAEAARAVPVVIAKPAPAAPAKTVDEGGGGMMSANQTSGAPVTEGDMPELGGATGWLNSKPLTRASLRGKVVVVDFWTYSCINCLRSLPYVNAWYQHYKDSGLVIIGVHSPEFDFEKDPQNVRQAIEKFGIQYPVALDNDMAIWKAFNNRFWPAHYFVDAQGRIRGHHFGEGKYARSERTIRQLLTEAGAKTLPEPLDDAAGEGITAAADSAKRGLARDLCRLRTRANFASPGSFARDSVKITSCPPRWNSTSGALRGRWKVGGERAVLDAAPGRIVFRFRARDLHLVLAPGADHKPVRFRVLLDGKPPGANHGMDTGADGQGTVNGQRLYQLIRQQGDVQEHEFTIEFLDAQVGAYSFTFG